MAVSVAVCEIFSVNDCIGLQFPNSVNDTDGRLALGDLVAESLMHHNNNTFRDIWVGLNRYTKDRAYNEYSGIATLMMFLHAYW